MVLNTPTNSVDILGLWDTPTHNAILSGWLKTKNLSELLKCCKNIDPLEQMDFGSRLVDGDEKSYFTLKGRINAFAEAQSSGNSYQHGLRELFEDNAQAEARSNTFIMQRISAAIRKVKEPKNEWYTESTGCSNAQSALTDLGMAAHTIMDSFSPAHEGNQLWVAPKQGSASPILYGAYLLNHYRKETGAQLTPELNETIKAALSARLDRALKIIGQGKCCKGTWDATK